MRQTTRENTNEREFMGKNEGNKMNEEQGYKKEQRRNMLSNTIENYWEYVKEKERIRKK